MHDKNEFNQPVGCIIENFSAVMPKKNILQGTYCILELLDINKHAARLFDVLSIDNQGESWTYLPYGPFNTCGEFQDWLKDKMT